MLQLGTESSVEAEVWRRLAALFVVDRLKSEVITSAITHYQHIAVLQARRQIVKRILNRQKVKHPQQIKVRGLPQAHVE